MPATSPVNRWLSAGWTKWCLWWGRLHGMCSKGCSFPKWWIGSDTQNSLALLMDLNLRCQQLRVCSKCGSKSRKGCFRPPWEEQNSKFALFYISLFFFRRFRKVPLKSISRLVNGYEATFIFGQRSFVCYALATAFDNQFSGECSEFLGGSPGIRSILVRSMAILGTDWLEVAIP